VALCLAEGQPVAELLGSESERLLATGWLVGGWVGLIAVSPLGRLSGAHLNPAVSAAFWALGRLRGADLAGYAAAQALGALVGAIAFRLLWGEAAVSVGGGVTHPTVPAGVAAALEAGMTAILVATVVLFVSRERLMRWTPLAIVPVLAAIVWLGSPPTGASLNPARSEGPALAFGDLTDLWIYVAAPLAGALAVALATRIASAAHPLTMRLDGRPGAGKI
jgi:aquaporin Z